MKQRHDSPAVTGHRVENDDGGFYSDSDDEGSVVADGVDEDAQSPAGGAGDAEGNDTNDKRRLWRQIQTIMSNLQVEMLHTDPKIGLERRDGLYWHAVFVAKGLRDGTRLFDHLLHTIVERHPTDLEEICKPGHKNGWHNLFSRMLVLPFSFAQSRAADWIETLPSYQYSLNWYLNKRKRVIQLDGLSALVHVNWLTYD